VTIGDDMCVVKTSLNWPATMLNESFKIASSST